MAILNDCGAVTAVGREKTNATELWAKYAEQKAQNSDDAGVKWKNNNIWDTAASMQAGAYMQ